MTTSRPLLALAWMTGAVLSFTAMAVAGRAIQVELNTFELMLYRSVIGLCIVSCVISARPRGFAIVRTTQTGLHARRNVSHFLGQNAWFYALSVIPLAQLVAIEFTSPLWVALLAPLMLAEMLTRARLIAALLGFAGVLVVAQPGTAPLHPGHAFALLAAVCFALNLIYTRQIMRFDGVLCVLFWMTASQAAMALVLSLPGGITLPSAATTPWVLIVAVTGLTAHFSLTSALGYAPASTVAPMEFIRLPIISLVGMLLYGEPLRIAVFLGGALIICANFLNMRDGTRPRAA